MKEPWSTSSLEVFVRFLWPVPLSLRQTEQEDQCKWYCLMPLSNKSFLNFTPRQSQLKDVVVNLSVCFQIWSTQYFTSPSDWMRWLLWGSELDIIDIEWKLKWYQKLRTQYGTQLQALNILWECSTMAVAPRLLWIRLLWRECTLNQKPLVNLFVSRLS